MSDKNSDFMKLSQAEHFSQALNYRQNEEMKTNRTKSTTQIQNDVTLLEKIKKMFIDIEKLISNFQIELNFENEKLIKNDRNKVYEQILASETYLEIIEFLSEYMTLAFKPKGVNGAKTFHFYTKVFKNRNLLFELWEKIDKTIEETQFHFYIFAIKGLLERFESYLKFNNSST